MQGKIVAVAALAAAIGLAPVAQAQPGTQDVAEYVRALRQGQDPVAFALSRLDRHDLLVFDDALHSAVEPWRFYADLVRHPGFRARARHIFLEIGPINHQSAIDAYLDARDDNPALLLPLVQNASDLGWPYQTYLDFLKAVRDANQGLAPAERLRVYGVDVPHYWPLMHTRRDWELSLHSGEARDYHLYKTIAAYLDNFSKGEKGIFLTNSRHAYKHIRNGKGQLYWNAGTFFHEFHPGKTYAIRTHHVALEIKARAAQPGGPRTREGLDGATVRWTRMQDGLWDCAHAALDYRPLALDIHGTPFGRAPYVGNHMLDVQAGQTMADAYDAVLFLAPVEQMHGTALADIYTPEFKRELARRIRVISSEDEIAGMLKRSGSATLDAYVAATYKPRAQRVEPLVAALGKPACKAD